jgi:hypothetical protein
MAEWRTANEREADQFDCALFGLIERAEKLAKRSRGWDGWLDVSLALDAVRPAVREMMHLKDRENTR